MRLFPSRMREISFWHYHFAGWILYSSLQFGLYFGLNDFHWKMVPRLSIPLIVIFFLLLGLRLYYRRLPFQNMPLFPLISRIVIVSLLTAVVSLLIGAGIDYTIFSAKLIKYINEPIHMLTRLSFSFPVFLVWSALFFGIKAWRDWLNEQDHTREATEAAQHAQLQMLRYQLNPHFLFNTLNSVRALVDEDTRNAKTMITELSEFLRYSLMSRNKPKVMLKEELDAIRLYISIEQQRYEDKLQVAFDIDQQTEEVTVPSFFIYPIVEHALWSGMQTSTMPLCLKIQSCFVNGRLKVNVSHSGYNVPTNGNGTRESSMEQVESRLKELFQGQYSIYSTRQNDQFQTIIDLAITNGVMHEEKV